MQLLHPTYKELQEIKSAEKKLLCWNEKRDQTILNMIQVLSFFFWCRSKASSLYSHGLT